MMDLETETIHQVRNGSLCQRRFLIATELESASTEPIHLLQNWRPPAK